MYFFETGVVFFNIQPLAITQRRRYGAERFQLIVIAARLTA